MPARISYIDILLVSSSESSTSPVAEGEDGVGSLDGLGPDQDDRKHSCEEEGEDRHLARSTDLLPRPTWFLDRPGSGSYSIPSSQSGASVW